MNSNDEPLVNRREVCVPGVGGPLIETSIDAPFQGASSSVVLVPSPRFVADKSDRPKSMTRIGLAFVFGFAMGFAMMRMIGA